MKVENQYNPQLILPTQNEKVIKLLLPNIWYIVDEFKCFVKN